MTDRDGCPNYSIREAFLSDLIIPSVIKLCSGSPFFQCAKRAYDATP